MTMPTSRLCPSARERPRNISLFQPAQFADALFIIRVFSCYDII